MSIAIVTGASSGIGQSAAIQLAARGSGVILTYNGNADGADDTVAAIEDAGGTAVALRLDTGRSETFAEFTTEVKDVLAEKWGSLTFNTLVNNAGFGESSPFESTSEDMFDRLYRVNVKGPYFLTQHLLPLLDDGGSIITTASNSSMPSGIEPGYSAYGSLKGAIPVFTSYLAKELSVRGIRVNAIAPGATRTRLGGDAFAKYPQAVQMMADRTLLGRIGEPDDIGKVITFLASDDGAWITAQTIEVAGGYGL
ncbi:short-chain dehydrogenase [Frondihabitans sp. PAMC 28766]|uniref:SDR family NAD(P)-dependent oxidoreductase n=1 Tax=Frondihabitans sp. PAMC 28766 TaxID=1795630 RepID=UPI00078B95A2|nr:SDR family oxidoreductase [Frondihabitans sp. PAMC 28766]AMM18960.1 short-chain dehydrogenase [Frondihabitans sp. PAMC 28766]